MGQPITVVAKPSSRSGVVRYETNRALTGMGHERYRAGDEILSGLVGSEMCIRDRAWRIVVAVVFLVLAALLATVALGRWHRRPLGSTRLVAMFCLWTIVFWAVRGGGLLFADHDAGFKVVHTILAVTSIGLAAVLYRVDQRVASAPGGTSEVSAPFDGR